MNFRKSIYHIHSTLYFVASELKDPICHSDECQIGSFSSEATIFSSDFYIVCFFSCIAIFFLVPSTKRKKNRQNIIVCGIETQKDYDLACEIEEKAIVMKTQ